MNAAYWGIIAVLVVGTAIVVYGWLADRAATKRRILEATSPPRRDIPGFRPTSRSPEYLSELEAAVRPERATPTVLDDATRHSLTERLAGAPTFPAGWPSRHFITDPSTGWSVLSHPLVLVCLDPIATTRELLPALERARFTGRSLVIVAPDAQPEVIATLRANMVQRKLDCLILSLADPELRHQLAALTGGRTVPRTDLQAGYLPDSALGSCATWVADEDDSWVLLG